MGAAVQLPVDLRPGANRQSTSPTAWAGRARAGSRAQAQLRLQRSQPPGNGVRPVRPELLPRRGSHAPDHSPARFGQQSAAGHQLPGHHRERREARLHCRGSLWLQRAWLVRQPRHRQCGRSASWFGRQQEQPGQCSGSRSQHSSGKRSGEPGRAQREGCHERSGPGAGRVHHRPLRHLFDGPFHGWWRHPLSGHEAQRHLGCPGTHGAGHLDQS